MNSSTAAVAETSRLQTLDSLRVLDIEPLAMFDQVVQVASLLCGTPVALISLVDRNRLYFMARAGLDARQVPSEHSLCDHAILTPQALMEVGDASSDPRFADSPLVTGPPGIRFYAGAPLVTSNGVAIGTLCVIDRKPGQLNESQRFGLDTLAQLTIELMELRRSEWELRQAMDAGNVQ